MTTRVSGSELALYNTPKLHFVSKIALEVHYGQLWGCFWPTTTQWIELQSAWSEVLSYVYKMLGFGELSLLPSGVAKTFNTPTPKTTSPMLLIFLVEAAQVYTRWPPEYQALSLQCIIPKLRKYDDLFPKNGTWSSLWPTLRLCLTKDPMDRGTDCMN